MRSAHGCFEGSLLECGAAKAYFFAISGSHNRTPSKRPLPKTLLRGCI